MSVDNQDLICLRENLFTFKSFCNSTSVNSLWPYKKSDPCFIFPCFFRECIIFMEFIALNHGNFHLANTDIRECIIFTEFLRKTRRNNGNIRIKIFYRVYMIIFLFFPVRYMVTQERSQDDFFQYHQVL